METPHELFALRSPLTHENANKAHSYDESIRATRYWTDEETPCYEGGRVVISFINGVVGINIACHRSLARAVRVQSDESIKEMRK